MDHGSHYREMTRNAHIEATAFGPRFGKLIRAYRDDLGLSARDLAERVWDDSGRKASISRLENGHVLRPEAKTVQAIAHALDIPPEEIDALRLADAVPLPALTADLESLARHSRDQLEALANRFEIDRAFERSESELRKLLEWKAEEYRAYRGSLDRAGGLSAIDSETNKLMKDAAASMDFEALDHHLARLDRTHSDQAIVIKEKRAAHALLRGRVKKAYLIFTSAAQTMHSSDALEMARLRNEYHKLLYDHGLRYPGEGLRLAIKMQRPAVAAVANEDHSSDWARYLQNLANALANFGARGQGARGITSITEAIDAYAIVSQHLTRQEDPEGWGMVQHNQGAALYLLSTKTDDPMRRSESLTEAVQTFRKALEVRQRDIAPKLWAMTLQNLAVALKELGQVTSGSNGRKLIDEALTSLKDSLLVRTYDANAMEWAMTQENIALAEYALAGHVCAADAQNHYAAALEHIHSALKVYAPKSAPFYFEKATNLRRTLDNLLR